MKFVFKSLIVLLIVLMAAPSFAQFNLMWGRENPMNMNNIHGVTVNPETSHLYIAHFADRNIHHFNEELEEVGVFNIGIGEIRGLGFDTQGNLLLAANGGNIAIIDLNGEVLRNFNNNGGSNTVDYDPENDRYVVGRFGGEVAYFDRQGNREGGFNSNVNITGICYYPVNGTLFLMDTDDPVFEYSIDGERVGVPLPNDVIGGGGGGGQDIAYDSGQRILYATGQCQPAWLGAFEDNYGAMPVPQVEPEQLDFNIAFGQDDEDELVITNIGEEGSLLTFDITVIEEDVNWLSIDPESGELEDEEEMVVTVTAATQDLEPGFFECTILVTTNSCEVREIEVPVTLTVLAGFGGLQGTVFSELNDAPIPNAVVSIPRFGFEAVTNDEGLYVFEEIPEWIYTLEVSAPDFLPATVEDVEVIEDEVTVQDIGLLHSRCELSEESIDRQLAPDEVVEIDLILSNTGNGPLTWSVTRDFGGGGNVEPWALREEVLPEDPVDDNRLSGIAFANGRFYVAGGNSGADENLIYVFDAMGEYMDQYPQFAESRYGMRDLGWDGSLLWGLDGETIYGFTPDGDLEIDFQSPQRSMRYMTCSTDPDLLWICSVTTHIYGIDTEGNVVVDLNRPEGGLHVYGLAWYPEDPDGFNLYVFSEDGDYGQRVSKVNIDNNEAMFVADLPDIEEVGAGGAFITGEWDPYAWVFLGMLDGNPDRLGIWQIQGRTGWVGIDPVEGMLAQQSETHLTVDLSAVGLPCDIEYQADLVFTHDGIGGETILPVSVVSMEGPAPTERTLEFDIGWNMVSLNLQPDELQIIPLMAPLTDEDLLILMKNGRGNFYNPEFGYNDIPFWSYLEGYLVKVTEDCEMIVSGESVMPNEPIQLLEGWQMVAYFPRVEVEVPIALSGLGDALLIAKDDQGHFCLPAWGFNDMPPMREGKGYLVKVSEDIELIYRLQEQAASFGRSEMLGHRRSNPQYYGTPVNSGSNMSLLVVTDRLLAGEIGVYAGDQLAGAGVLKDGVCGIAVWGDDPTTSVVDGALPGQALKLELANETGRHSVGYVTFEGEGIYEQDDVWVVNLESAVSIPSEFGIVSAHPNPFNSSTRLSFNLPSEAFTEMSVYDMNGRLVSELVSGRMTAGTHTVSFDGDGLASGIYLVQLQASGQVSRWKVTLMK